MKISNRLAVATVMFLSVALATGVLTWQATVKANEDAMADKTQLLISELESRRIRVINYLEHVTNDLLITANSRFAQHALIDFSEAYRDLGDSAEEELKRLYVHENPNPVGRKHLLISGSDGSDYSDLHREYHAWTSNIAKVRDYYDIFLVDPEGHIVYTVFKEDDFATNLLTGEYKDTELGQVFAEIVANPRSDEIYARDFVRYEPSHGKPAAFLGTAVNYEGGLIGAIIVQLKPEPFNRIMRHTRSLGDSGETYIVGPNKLLRTRSRFSEKDTVLETIVDTESVNAALEGRNGIHIIDDYRGVPVLSAYAPIKEGEASWAVLAEMDMAEIRAESTELIRWLAMISAIASVLAFLVGWFLAGRDQA